MNYQTRLADAVRQFWQTRARQDAYQDLPTGVRDAGNRTAVTGGKHLDGFLHLVQDVLMESGLSQVAVHTRKRDVVLPGFFRPTKEWDLIAVHNERLLAIVEFKSQVGSFGNNFNNRVEEAIGNATDVHTAYREGAFKPSPAPWLGYLMLLEEAPGSMKPVKVNEPHFPVLRAWRGTPSYARRYELFCQRLVRERLYDAACFLLSHEERGMGGWYTEAVRTPSPYLHPSGKPALGCPRNTPEKAPSLDEDPLQPLNFNPVTRPPSAAMDLRSSRVIGIVGIRSQPAEPVSGG